MAPRTASVENLVTPDAAEADTKLVAPQAGRRKYEIVYKNVLLFGYWHVASIYALYLCFTSAKPLTLFYTLILVIMADIGMTAGAHRLWSHRAYKAKLPLQIILMVFNTLSFQNTAITWVRDHRLHHKYSDTDADPHNASRGFFYSHVGWLLVRKHPDVIKHGKKFDISDVENNPVLRFQKKYAIPWILSVGFIIPTLIPMYLWGETLNNAWHICAIMRYTLSLNFTFLGNSAAHLWGYRPYDKNILPAQNIPVSILTCGEGFHNYHHSFPWDYRAAELGNNWLNLTTLFIDFFAWVGWAYDMKVASPKLIESKKRRVGDGTNLWGFGDKDMSNEEKETTIVLHPKAV